MHPLPVHSTKDRVLQEAISLCCLTRCSGPHTNLSTPPQSTHPASVVNWTHCLVGGDGLHRLGFPSRRRHSLFHPERLRSGHFLVRRRFLSKRAGAWSRRHTPAGQPCPITRPWSNHGLELCRSATNIDLGQINRGKSLLLLWRQPHGASAVARSDARKRAKGPLQKGRGETQAIRGTLTHSHCQQPLLLTVSAAFDKDFALEVVIIN